MKAENVSYVAIAEVAYRLYEAEGRPEGRAAEHWIKAEELVRSRSLAPQAARAQASVESSAKPSAPSRSSRTGKAAAAKLSV
jgi:hypothetical protein